MSNRIFWLMCFLLPLFLTAAPRDSVGVKTIAGRQYIQYKVGEKETAFSIAKRYKLSVDSLLLLNGKPKQLKKGSLLLIPLANGMSETEKIDAAHANADAVSTILTVRHKVAKGETVNKIATRYGITVQDLVRWNGIRDNRIEAGQTLIVNAQGAISAYRPWNKPQTQVNDTASKPINTLAAGDEILESGMASVDENSPVSKVTYAPAGGLVLVTHSETQQQVIVQAEGGLPNSGAGFVIQLTKSDAAKLGIATPAVVPVKLKYLTENP